jgi:hypothetical protein
MRSRYCVLVLITVLLALFAGTLVVAQTQQTTGDQIVQVIAGRAKPGSEAQYIEGRKRHIEWHRAQNDKWAFHTYDVISGEATGSQITVSSPHKWADRDAREQFMRDDQADVMKNIAPNALPAEISFWRPRNDMGRAGAPKATDPPTPYFTVQHFLLNSDAMPGFVENVKRVSAATDKANYPAPKGLWYQLLNGGETPHFVLVTPRKNWAEFETPKETLDEAVKRAAGAEGTAALSNLRKGIKRAWSETIRHNDELSYHPAQ